jgi:hypothetical protein
MFEKAIPIASLLCFILAILTVGFRLPWVILMTFSSVMFMVGILVGVNYRRLAQRIGKDFAMQQGGGEVAHNTNGAGESYVSMGRRLGLMIVLLALVCIGFALVAHPDPGLSQLGRNIIVYVSLAAFLVLVIPTILGWFRR